MKNKQILLGLILILISSCVGFMETVNCRDFSLNEENYWFPLAVGDTVSFVNTKDEIKTFTVVDKHISHRKEYTSDTGCGCYDESRMLLKSGVDSLWLRREVMYVNDNKGNNYEEIVFTINGKQSGFYETDRSKINSVTINEKTFTDVVFYTCSECEKDLSVNKMYSVKNLGVVQFEQVNGEVWTRTNLSNYGATTMESFIFEETTCD